MPSWVSKHSQPGRKLATLEKREARIRGALKAGENQYHVEKAAEKVRLAQLALIKAELALIREYPCRDPDERQSIRLHAEERQWVTISVEEIIQMYGGF